MDIKTTHRVIFKNAIDMEAVPSESIDLMVTSPPYPMVEMWDDMFARQNPSVKKTLENGKCADAFELMHQVLDRVWEEAFRVLKSGGFACINIGDATRTINGNFELYPNHMRVLKSAMGLGFTVLPCILWRKQTNAPNKFMGSGMLPAGAYVTLEHEYVLILRKGPKRVFKNEEDKQKRRESAVFWEERNRWYSDVWFDLKGTPQTLNDKDARVRSAAYPFEIAYRLINMYSAKEDVVLDPFLGTGTTTAAAIAACRNSIGYEIDPSLKTVIDRIKGAVVESSRQLIRKRLARHLAFVVHRLKTKGRLKYTNAHYGFPTMTSQETEIIFNDPLKIVPPDADMFEVQYSDEPQGEFCKDWSIEIQKDTFSAVVKNLHRAMHSRKSAQLELF